MYTIGPDSFFVNSFLLGDGADTHAGCAGGGDSFASFADAGHGHVLGFVAADVVGDLDELFWGDAFWEFLELGFDVEFAASPPQLVAVEDLAFVEGDLAVADVAVLG